MKNSNDTIWNRTRDLPACSAVPQPTAPPRSPNNNNNKLYTEKVTEHIDLGPLSQLKTKFQYIYYMKAVNKITLATRLLDVMDKLDIILFGQVQA